MRSAAALFVLLATVPAQSLSWLEGPAPGALALRTVSEATPDAVPTTVLTALAVLPIEITNRTAQQELDAARARRIVRQGLARVELPGGGRVFAYRRGTGDHGYLRVGGDGAVGVVLEAPGAVSPFADRIGVAADGRHGAVPEVLLPVLHLMRLDGGTYASTGRPARSVATSALVEATTVCVGATHVFFATADERLWRCPLADGGQPQEITPPPIAGARLKGELALSGDGHTVAFLYGVQPTFGIYLGHDTLATRRLPVADAKYEEPGYLPDVVAGPRFMLNDAGTRLLYVDATIRDETYLMDTTGATSTVHVTSDANFQPYIGAVILPVFAQTVLFLGVGDPARFDVYATATGQTGVLNLTQTAGNRTPPFVSGELIVDNVMLTPAGQLLLAERTATAAPRLRRFDLGTGASLLMAEGLTAPLALADAPAGLQPDLLLARGGGDILLRTTDATPRLFAPGGVELVAPTHIGNWSRAVTARVGSVTALVFHANDGSILALPPKNAPQRVIRTGAGNLLLDGPSLWHAGPAGARAVQAGAPHVVVSGAGA